MRKFILPGIAVALAFAVLVGLGIWQLVRLDEKERLISQVEAMMKAPPRQLPLQAEWNTPSFAALDFSPVTISGTFRHELEVYLFASVAKGNRGDEQQGLFVLTPFDLADGGSVLVNRGFVPAQLKDPKRRIAGQVEGNVTLTGILKIARKPGLFTPEPDRANRLWFAADPAGMATLQGLTDVAPFVIDADDTPVPGGWPSGGHTVLNFSNNHLQYALTWFGLALVLFVMTLFQLLKRRRPNSGITA
ncbi:MAG: SURF1 family protein [Hyphomicrobiales bacterium]